MKVLNETDKLIESVKSIHLIGVGGAGMAPLAEILLSKGYTITGSDNNESDTLNRMRSLGINITMGHLPETVEHSELIIHSAAIMADNAEIVAARAAGIPVLSRAKLLGYISRKYENTIGVTGTHGKTTVTSMITQILTQNGYDPSAVVGGKLPLIGGNGRAGSSDLLVCEACEYVDTFLQMTPDIAVLLNIDDDHLEYFKTVDNLKASFYKFCNMASKFVVINGDDELMSDRLDLINVKQVSFGLNENNDYTAKNIVTLAGNRAEFDLYKGKEKIVTLTLNVPGKHNIYNALAAAATCTELLVKPSEIAAGLADFRGAGRRFEILGTPNDITIADDYAHHPTELTVTLQAAREMNFNRVIAVFQPFTFSRTSLLMQEFADALSIADCVVLTEIMGSREINTYGVQTSQLAEKIKGSVWFNTFEEVAEHVYKIAKPNDLVITLGCGDVYKIAKILLSKYK